MQIVPAGSEKNKNVSHVAVATRKELYCSFIEVRLGKLEEDLWQQQVGWNECELVFNCELEIEPELEQVLVNGELAQHHVQANHHQPPVKYFSFAFVTNVNAIISLQPIISGYLSVCPVFCFEDCMLSSWHGLHKFLMMNMRALSLRPLLHCLLKAGIIIIQLFCLVVFIKVTEWGGQFLGCDFEQKTLTDNLLPSTTVFLKLLSLAIYVM